MCANIPLAKASNVASLPVSEAAICTPPALLGGTVKSHGKEHECTICYQEEVKSLEQW